MNANIVFASRAGRKDEGDCEHRVRQPRPQASHRHERQQRVGERLQLRPGQQTLPRKHGGQEPEQRQHAASHANACYTRQQAL